MLGDYQKVLFGKEEGMQKRSETIKIKTDVADFTK